MLKTKLFRDTPNSSAGGMPRSASSYSVQAPDMEDVKESVRQVGDKTVVHNQGCVFLLNNKKYKTPASLETD